MDCLIVDDERELADTIKEYLAMFGIEAAAAYTYDEAVGVAAKYAVCILDVNLPDGSGYDLAKYLREKSPTVKILFLSARREDFDIVRGYSVGGDDFIIKPCSLPVILVKVRHALGCAESTETFGDLVIDRKERAVYKNGRSLDLKNMEFNLFDYLYTHRGEVLEKERILRDVWGEGYYTDNTLNVHINRIREKLEDDRDGYIRTVWGVGYIFRA